MSPALFLLCMEFFSRLIKKNTSNSNFNFHPKCKKLKITHLLFADDLIFFSRGDLPSIYILMECLQEFRDVSSLAVNTFKLGIFTVGTQNDVLDGILTRMESARRNMHVRYLGIPLAGQLEFIRSVIQGGECFWLQVFPLSMVWLGITQRIVNPSQCGQVAQERNWLLYAEQSTASRFAADDGGEGDFADREHGAVMRQPEDDPLRNSDLDAKVTCEFNFTEFYNLASRVIDEGDADSMAALVNLKAR
ncbi:UNVERIFIED_CONTAM: hypothetical protein Scaly_2680200 [Sesamum calycinum]|uniref:Reverse transcriptase domain-containing protein n=1 Tax=Sesamum calycinum TaxID=2727403 RepID=A0AAW2J7D3_9LAMI